MRTDILLIVVEGRVSYRVTEVFMHTFYASAAVTAVAGDIMFSILLNLISVSGTP